jgi:MFS family permease
VRERARWVPVGLLFAGGMINYMDRAALSVAAPLVMRDLKLDQAQLGIIFSSFFAVMHCFTFVGGYAAVPLIGIAYLTAPSTDAGTDSPPLRLISRPRARANG